MSDRILCVDDDPNVLSGLERGLRRHFDVVTALGGLRGLEAIRMRGPFAVVVSDMRMPAMDGIQFLTRVREMAPQTVRIMLTGMTDQRTAAEAVNEGHIFRFLTKPCPPETLVTALRAGVDQYRLITAEREVLEKTLSGALKVVADILALVRPAAYGRAARVRQIVRQILRDLEAERPWEIEIAAILSQIGCVTLPDETLEKALHGLPMSEDEEKMVAEHPAVGSDLLRTIPRMEGVAEIIRHQDEPFTGGETTPLGSRVLKVALDYERLLSSGQAPVDALRALETAGSRYDRAVVLALARTLSAEPASEKRCIPIAHLSPGMVIAEDIRTKSGLLLIRHGQEVTESMILRLANFARLGLVHDEINVLAPDAPAAATPALQEVL